MKKSTSFISILCILITGLVLAFFAKLFFIDFLFIRGDSMTPTLKENQLIFINKAAYGLCIPGKADYIIKWKDVQKGDVIIFLHDNKIVVKRCALQSGESLEILYDREYSFYYIQVGKRKVKLSKEQKELFEGSKTVPEGYIFVLGDNDSNSVDSRNYGFVATKNITGRVIGK